MKKLKDPWEALQITYQGYEKIRLVRLQTLQRDFINLMMREAKSTHEFIMRSQTIINHLKSQGETIIEQKFVEKISRSLPPNFDPVVIAIEQSKDKSTFKTKQLIGYLQSHEERIKHSIENLVQAFQSTVKIEAKATAPFQSNKTQWESSTSRGCGRGRGRGNK